MDRRTTFPRALAVLVLPAICLAQPGVVSTVVGSGSGTYSGDGGPALKAGVPSPTGLAIDRSGNMYILETGIARVRKVTAAGTITTYAGTGSSGFSGDGGAAINAQLFPGHGIAVDGAGNLYIADLYNNRIRKVDPAGIITTVAGTGAAGSLGQGGFSGDGGPAVSAMLNLPNAVAADAAGNLYIADSSNYRIRRVDGNTGVISTVAGNGSVPPNKQTANDGGIATQVPIEQPTSVTLDSAGNIYFSSGARVQRVDSSGIIQTVAGNGTRGYTGDGGPAISAQFENPQDVAIDSLGNIYVSDASAHVVRKVNAAAASTAPIISLVSNAFGGSQTLAPNTWVQVKGVNLAPPGDARIWAGGDFINNQLPTQLDGVSVTVNGRPAFIYYISPTQVNILTPPDPISGTIAVQLTNGGVKSNVVDNNAQPLSLAFFTFDASHVTAVHADGSLIGPATLYPGLSTPAKPGETIIVYGNGFGTTTVPIVSGALTQSGDLSGTLIVGIGGFIASVPFAGLVAPGEFQFNIVVPSSAPDGDLGISASYDGALTPKSATLAVQH